MRLWKGIVVALVIVSGCVAGAWYALRQIRASFSYGILAEFESVPPNDKALEQWWRSQPGVVETTVFVDRRQNSVGVLWIQVQSAGPRNPPVPDFRAAFEQFGYRGLRHIHYDWRGSGDWPNEP